MPYERAGRVPDLERDVDVLSELSFEDVYRSHRARVRGLCRKLLRSEADAEDAVQEAMLRAYKAWAQFRKGDNPWPWLAAIAANVCRDMGRRETRAAAYVASLDPHEQYSADCYEDVARNARRALVHDALASLPPGVGAPLYLRDIEGWSVPEIARLRGRSVASARTSLTRSRRTLATRIEELAKDRRQWPLPAALPVVARFRTRLTRMKAAADGGAARALLQIDAAVATITSIRLTGLVQVTAAFLAVTAMTVAAREATSSSVPPLHSPAWTAGAVTGWRSSAEPTGHADPSAPRPAPAPVVVRAARVNDGGVTETPAATATPPASGPVAEGDVYLFVGPVRVDCSRDEAPRGAWEASCDALSQAPLPSLRPDADED